MEQSCDRSEHPTGHTRDGHVTVVDDPAVEEERDGRRVLVVRDDRLFEPLHDSGPDSVDVEPDEKEMAVEAYLNGNPWNVADWSNPDAFRIHGRLHVFEDARHHAHEDDLR